jgi:hypothetical protein
MNIANMNKGLIHIHIIPYITIRFITSEYINHDQTLCSMANYVPVFL